MTARFCELGFVVFSAPKAQKLLPDEGSYFPLIRPLAGAPSPQGEGLELNDKLKFESCLKKARLAGSGQAHCDYPFKGRIFFT